MSSDFPQTPAEPTRPLILWLAGVGWDEVRGTDRRLVEELSAQATVLWCDPPAGAWRIPRTALMRPFDEVANGVLRIRVPAPPWSTKRGIRVLTAAQTHASVRRALDALGAVPDIQVVASPIQRFIRGAGETKVYYQTDDWLEGAPLMRLSPSWVSRNIQANSWDADAVTAVTDLLLFDVMGTHAQLRPSARRRVLANGCYPMAPGTDGSDRDPVAGLVGQLNERLDLGVLEALAEEGVPIRVIGPRTDKDRAFGRRLDRILTVPTIDYVGPVAAEEVPGQLSRLGAGLTPYAPTPFNRASFPLKSLEYLSAGLAVVSTDLPAVRWLDTELISVGKTSEEFVEKTRRAIDERSTVSLETERRAYSGQHTWSRRAEEFLDLAGVSAQT